MQTAWDPATPGTVLLPSGRLIRGRGLRRSSPLDQVPDFAVHLLGRRPAPVEWEMRWVRWPDFWIPVDQRDARDALRKAWNRAAGERVEIACMGGHGRTGTALACVAVLDGVPPQEAVTFIRGRYDARAIETPWQRWFVSHFADRATT
ncbi:protein-tyrosine phosphatase family protein [Nakamurella sp. GG22]